jgi:hypothetical protein
LRIDVPDEALPSVAMTTMAVFRGRSAQIRAGRARPALPS